MTNFYLKNKKRNVNATLEYNDGEYILKKGSNVSKDISDKFRASSSVLKKREGFIKNSILQKDIVFKSPSVAGEFVLGTSCNGREKWKTSDGSKLREIIK